MLLLAASGVPKNDGCEGASGSDKVLIEMHYAAIADGLSLDATRYDGPAPLCLAELPVGKASTCSQGVKVICICGIRATSLASLWSPKE